MTSTRWPELWQAEAREALTPYIDSDWQVDLWVGPPTALSGTRYGGYVYMVDGGDLEVIHDRSGRPHVYPWKLSRGPVLRLKVRSGAGKRWRVVYAHPEWHPTSGLP